jgi:hypothetical protein
MANIIGEHFFKYTDDQVKQRQKIYAKRDRTSEDLAYMNGKTAWLKLVSSIDIDQDKSIELGLNGNLTQEKLARNLVLFGGTTGHFSLSQETADELGIDTKLLLTRSGISDNNSIFNFTGAYGLGGDDFGKRPMPGIISAQVKPKNRGSLREATVQIKAYNKGQLDLLDAIYLRIGYTMLLEWGWSNYYDNAGAYQSNPSNTLAWEFLEYNGPKPKTTDINYNDPNNKSYRVYGTGSAYWDFLEKIEKKRGFSNGNYDAMLAKVANFSWEFGNDGAYDVTLKLISVGDVVESLKVNIFSPTTITSNSNSSDRETWISKYFKHDIGRHLWSRISFKAFSNKNTIAAGSTGAVVTGTDTESVINLPTIWDSTNNQNNDVIISSKNSIALEQITRNNGSTTTVDKEKSVMIYYRFGAFLKYMEDELLLYDESGRPIITIDYDTNTNLVFRTPNQISTFPNKCIIGGIQFGDNTLFPGCAPYPASSIYPGIIAGLLMNVYLEFDFILDTIETSTDQETGDLSIFTFLKNICDSINDSLGNYNKIEPVLDEDRLYFIDQTPIPKIEKLKELIRNYGRTADLYADKPTYFNPYGIGPNGGSLGTFVKKFSIKTELTNEFATIVTVGAQANGAVVGEDATLLSKWNKGLTDRIIPVKTDFLKSNISSSSKSNETTFEDIKNQYLNVIVRDYLDNSLREEGANNSYESDKKVMKTFIDYINQKNTQASGSVTTGLGFIPLNLNLTCEGISGPKIYQQFSIDTNFLPKKYPDVLRFLIRGITHNIQNNTWETTFDSLSIPEQVEVYSEPFNFNYNIVTRGATTRAKLNTNEKYLYYFILASLLRGINKNINLLYNHPLNKSKVAITSKAYQRSLQRIQQSNLLPSRRFGATGLGPVATAALIGNIVVESRLDWTVTNNIGAFGLVQWLNQRKLALEKKYGSGIRGVEGIANQVAFIFNELNGEIPEYRSDKKILQDLLPLENEALQYIQRPNKNALDQLVIKATEIIFSSYEIPGDQSLPERTKYALEAIQYLVGGYNAIIEDPNILGRIPVDNTATQTSVIIKDPKTGKLTTVTDNVDTFLDPVKSLAFSEDFESIQKLGTRILIGK